MKDVFVYLAGSLGLAISIVHGYLGERKVITPIRSPSASGKRVLSAIMFLSAVYWGVASLLLLAVPTYIPSTARPIVVTSIAAVYTSGSIGNLWATRGRHFGWILLALAAVMTLAGI